MVSPCCVGKLQASLAAGRDAGRSGEGGGEGGQAAQEGQLRLVHPRSRWMVGGLGDLPMAESFRWALPLWLSCRGCVPRPLLHRGGRRRARASSRSPRVRWALRVRVLCVLRCRALAQAADYSHTDNHGHPELAALCKVRAPARPRGSCAPAFPRRARPQLAASVAGSSQRLHTTSPLPAMLCHNVTPARDAMP